MLKGSALYMVIIIALVIGILCSALIVGAYFYRLQYQISFRYDRLENNVYSGINMLLANQDSSFKQETTFSLFDNNSDSVTLKKVTWGIYDIGIVKAFIQKDTLYNVFSIAHKVDSSKWCALYLVDEDRPLGLNGKTAVRGDAYIPLAGVKTAYINNKFYEGDPKLIIGTKHSSDKFIPKLNQTRIDQLEEVFNTVRDIDTVLLNNYTINNSFLKDTKWANFGKKVQTIANISLSGNIILYSDTTLILDSTAILNNVLVFAKSIQVKKGFKGTCQLFATDTIGVGKNCVFNYPSCIGLLRFKEAKNGLQVKINIADNTLFSGILFNYEKTATQVKPVIGLGEGVIIKGQIYSQGYIRLSDKGSNIAGSVYTGRFLYETMYSHYENYLINAKLDSKALSPYYLTSLLMPPASKKKKVLQWLEQN